MFSHTSCGILFLSGKADLALKESEIFSLVHIWLLSQMKVKM